MKHATRHLFHLLQALLIATAIHTLHSQPPQPTKNVFTAHLSDGWYPKTQTVLNKQINDLDATAQSRYNAISAPGAVRALIVPHAGYIYSGDIAASAYRTIQSQKPKKVIILAPSHSIAFTGVVTLPSTHYQLPTGTLPLDTRTIKELTRHTLFTYNDSVFSAEHSLEIQLPLLHHYLPHARYIPLIIGSVSQDQMHTIAKLLRSHIDNDTIVVASSDFLHHGPRFGYTPFKDHILLRIRQRDAQAIAHIQNYDLNNFLTYIQQTNATICGRMPIALLLALIEQNTFGPLETRITGYSTSVEKTGDTDNSVSYAGIAFTTEKRTDMKKDDQLTQYEKRSLLEYSRTTLTQAFKKDIPEELQKPILSTAALQAGGVFVTLYKNKNLRGCIGRITSNNPTYQTVSDMTHAAAFSDSRFTPVTQNELTDITITISLLTQPKKVGSYQNIEIGRHGIILSQENKRAVFLPKVPIEQNWDRATTLTHLSKKAGLAPQAWKESKTIFHVFESIDFPEQ